MDGHSRPLRRLRAAGGRTTARALAGTVARDVEVEDAGLGSVRFAGALDLRGAGPDFAAAVRFARGSVEVASGGLLDRPARVALRGIFPPPGRPHYARELAARLARQGAALHCYDAERGVCTFDVPHFSKYGLFSDEEDDDAGAGGATAAAAAAAAAAGQAVKEPAATSGHYGMMDSDEEEEEGEDDDAERSASEQGSEGEYASSQDSEGDTEEDEEEDEGEEGEGEDGERMDEDEQEIDILDAPMEAEGEEEGEEEEHAHEDEAAAALLAPPAAPLPPIRRVIKRPPSRLPLPITTATAAAAASIAVPKSAVDANVLLGRSSRVSWGPNGLLCVVQSGASPSSVTLRQLRVSPTLAGGGSPANYAHCLEPLLACYTAENQHQPPAPSSASAHPDPLTSIPGFALRSAASGVQAARAISRQAKADSGSDSDAPAKRKVHFALKLVDALWGVMGLPAATREESERAVADVSALPAKEQHMQRRRAFLQWLVDYAGQTPFRAPPADPDNADDEAELAEILQLLCANDIGGACDLACRRKDYHLAMLLAQVEGPLATRALVREQLQEWRETGADQFINANRLRIYALLAGCMVWPEGRVPGARARLSVYAIRSWPRGLLQQLQYGCSAVHGVREAVAGYERAFTRFEDLAGKPHVRCAALPLPDYLVESQLDEDENLAGIPLDVCFELLRVFAAHAPVATAVLPETYTAFTLDHRLGWTLYTVLMALGVPRMDDVAYQLHVEFALQLELDGLWPWAVFVLQHIGDDAVRAQAVRDLLWRQSWHTVSAEDVDFLSGQLGIPLAEIKTAALMNAKARFKHEEAAAHALQGGLWEDAYELFVQHIACDLILDQRLDELVDKYLAPLQASGVLRGREGQAFLDYVAFLNGDEVDLPALARGIAHLPAPTPRARLCLSEMASQVASKMAIASTLDGTALLQAVEAINAMPLPWTYRMPQLCRAIGAYMEQAESAAAAH